MVLGEPSTLLKIIRPLVIDGPHRTLVQLKTRFMRSALAGGELAGTSRLIRFWLAVVPSATLLTPVPSALSTKKRGNVELDDWVEISWAGPQLEVPGRSSAQTVTIVNAPIGIPPPWVAL